MLVGLRSFLGLRRWSIPELIQVGWVQCHVAVTLRSSFACWLFAGGPSKCLEAGCIPLFVAPSLHLQNQPHALSRRVESFSCSESLWPSPPLRPYLPSSSNPGCADLLPFSPYTRLQALVKSFWHPPAGKHHLCSWDEDWVQSSFSTFKGSCDYMGAHPAIQNDLSSLRSAG